MLGCNLQQHNRDQVLGSGYKLLPTVRTSAFGMTIKCEARFLDLTAGPANSLLWGAILCIAGCLTAFLDSTH